MSLREVNLVILEPLTKLKAIAAKPSQAIDANADWSLVKQSIAYLSSSEAASSLAMDPYWPKWNSPWWHMLLLNEMGLVADIPHLAITRMLDVLNSDYYLKFFPLTENEVPPGFDAMNQVPCHCQLGSMHCLFANYGIDLDEKLPWLRSWYARYQLPDGGLNCDETAYLRDTPKSSVVSTLPPLEALLSYGVEALTATEIDALDRGAGYLIEKRLCRRSGSETVIDDSWLQLCFPRFFEYDILRGISFLLRWSLLLNRRLPANSIIDCVSAIDNAFPDGALTIQRSIWQETTTRYVDSTGNWKKDKASTFQLLEAVGKIGSPSIYLTRIWSTTKNQLRQVIELGLLDEARHHPA